MENYMMELKMNEMELANGGDVIDGVGKGACTGLVGGGSIGGFFFGPPGVIIGGLIGGVGGAVVGGIISAVSD